MWSLAAVTGFRLGHPYLVYGLPVVGAAWGLGYARFGQSVAGGNNLVIDNLHEPSGTLPWRMAPLVLLGTLVTHLFGGSAGREGTAVQMGASLADGIYRLARPLRPVRSHVLMAGIAGGFGAVFGTPVGGALFALEVGTIGRTDYAALLPCLVASFVGHWVTQALAPQHTQNPAPAAVELDPILTAKWLLVGAMVAIVGGAFIAATHAVAKHGPSRLPVRMFVGGLAVVLLWRLTGTQAYLGLGDDLLPQALSGAALSPWAWLGKAAFTAVTLGSGFLGGEVTPLFVTGAALGHALAGVLHLPVDLTAGVCMVAMFGAAANAPLALIVMGVELMGATVLPHAAIVVATAYLLIGPRSIYSAQRLSRDKMSAEFHPTPQRLHDLHRP
jgi:H+/Cl- antiporter ClcA